MQDVSVFADYFLARCLFGKALPLCCTYRSDQQTFMIILACKRCCRIGAYESFWTFWAGLQDLCGRLLRPLKQALKRGDRASRQSDNFTNGSEFAVSSAAVSMRTSRTHSRRARSHTSKSVASRTLAGFRAHCRRSCTIAMALNAALNPQHKKRESFMRKAAALGPGSFVGT